METMDEIFFSDSPSEYISVPYTSPEFSHHSGNMESFLSPNPSFSDTEFFVGSFQEKVNWEEKLKGVERFRKEHDKSPDPPNECVHEFTNLKGLINLKKSCEKASYTHFSRNFLEECPMKQLINFCRIYGVQPLGDKDDLVEKILEEELKHIKSI